MYFSCFSSLGERARCVDAAQLHSLAKRQDWKGGDCRMNAVVHVVLFLRNLTVQSVQDKQRFFRWGLSLSALVLGGKRFPCIALISVAVQHSLHSPGRS